MQSVSHPSGSILTALSRSQTILQARVRESQYRELSARQRAGLLRGFMFVHLKEDLDVDPIDWIGCLDPFDASDDSRPPSRRGRLTRYGIAKELQSLLAGVRTDLDSFSDVEAFALMTSAYRMTQHDFPECVEGFPSPADPHDWDFLEVELGMKGSGSKYEYLKRQLSVSHSGAFKIWMLSLPLKITAWILAVAAVVFAIWACFHWAAAVVVKPITLWDIGAFIATTIAIMLATYLIGKRLMQIVRFRDSLIRIGIGLAVAVLGWLVAGLHLAIFDPWFLRNGSIDRFRKA
jgi:hypothetical protein